MRRGFKAEAERISANLRKEIGNDSTERLSLEKAAAALGVEIRSAGDLVDIARLKQIESLQPGAFSACTLEVGARRVIVWSPLSSTGRRNSDIAHELSHILLKHSVQEVRTVGGLTFFGCDPEEEQEANWLAGCLLLPRHLLIEALKRGMDATALAKQFEVSVQMANFRIRATGALRQVQR